MYYIMFYLLTFFSIYGAVHFTLEIYKSLRTRTDKTGVKIYEKAEKKWTQT
jgi:hypothetical protein